MSLKDLDCSQVTKLEDIQTEGKYIDPSGQNNPVDKKLVSCLQTHYKNKLGIEQEYNELKYIIDEHFADKKSNPYLYKALCECCKEKVKYKSTGHIKEILFTERDRFMECMKKQFRNQLISKLTKK
jgi:hypothetical protein